MGSSLQLEDYGEVKTFYTHKFDGLEIDRGSVERYETISRLIDELNLSPGRRVLDIGAGPGVISKVLSRKFEVVYAFDLVASPDMQSALQEASQIHFIQGLLPGLPLADSCMDLVVFSEVLEHLYKHDQIRAIESIARVVKRGGLVVLTTPNPIGVRSLLLVPFRLLRQLRGKPPFGQPVENWIKPTELQRMVRTWFSIEKMAGTNYMPPLAERLPSSIGNYVYGVSDTIGRKQMLSGFGEYQYYVLRRL